VREQGVTRKLIGFSMEGKAFPRHGYRIFSGSQPVGTVASGFFFAHVEKASAPAMCLSHWQRSAHRCRLKYAIRRRLPWCVRRRSSNDRLIRQPGSLYENR
jgi:hypothetical protein